MKKLTIIKIFIILTFTLFCQNKATKDIYPIRMLEVVNFKLFPTLDTIIQMKEEVKWYKGALFFVIEFNEDSLKPDLFFVRAYEKIFYHDTNIMGFFNHKEHYFIVKGNTIDTSIFQKTNKSRNFDFSFPVIRRDKNGKPILGQFDTFAVWSVRYKLGDFKILSFFTHDENDLWFNNVYKEYGEE